MKFHLGVWLLLAIFLTVSSLTAAKDPGMALPGVVEMDLDTVNSSLGKEKAFFLEIYAPWCGQCQSAVPELDLLGKAYEKSPNAKDLLVIGKLDATEHHEIGQQFDVQGFPTFLFFPAGSSVPVEYDDSREATAFAAFLVKSVKGLEMSIEVPPQYWTELDYTNFNAVIKDPTKSVLVMFYSPQCVHCRDLKPTYNELARIFANEKEVVIAGLNAADPVHQNLMTAYDVDSFPTIIFFPKGAGVAPLRYSHGRDIEDFLIFINRHAGTQRLVNGDLSWDYGVSAELSKAVAKVAKASGEEARKAELEEVRRAAARRPESEAITYYVTVAGRVAEKGASYISGELARIQRNLEGPVEGTRRDELLTRMNILTSIKQEL